MDYSNPTRSEIRLGERAWRVATVPPLAPFDHLVRVHRDRGWNQLGPLMREQGHGVRLAAPPIHRFPALPERDREPAPVFAPRPVGAPQTSLCLDGGPKPHPDVVQHRRLDLRWQRIETSNP